MIETAVAHRVRWTGTPVVVASDRCKGCELCVAACPHHALALDLEVVNPLGHHPVHLLADATCKSCAFCARVCPDAGLTVLAPPRGTER